MDDFAGLVARYGLTAVFLFTFLENTGLPIPAFPVLMLAGAARRVRRMGPAGPSHAGQDGGGPPARKWTLSGGCARFRQFRLTEPGAGTIFSGLPYHVPW